MYTNNYNSRKEDFIISERLNYTIFRELAKGGYNVTEVSEQCRQLKGVDIVLKKDGVEKLVDIKSATKYWNRDLQTYSLELFSNNNHNGEGWFVSNNSVTTHYLFVWVRAENYKLHNISALECCLVSKEVIDNYLKELGYDKHQLVDLLNKKGRSEDKRDVLYLKNGLKVVRSKHLIENPVNLIIPRKTLRQLADGVYGFDI